MLLGVNIDHVATLRQVRAVQYPDPVEAALIAEKAGADSITLHLREDRRHIQERDVKRLRERINIPINLEMAITEEMMQFAELIKPEYCCLVPEKRQELTTEGGLDVAAHLASVKDASSRLSDAGIRVSLFIDAIPEQLAAATQTGAPCIELHTGHYADATEQSDVSAQLEKIKAGVLLGDDLGLNIHAGHGLNYENVLEIASIPRITELNIGHSIIAQAVSVGMYEAVKQIKHLINSSADYYE